MCYGGHFDVDSEIIKMQSLEQKMNDQFFWSDKEKSEKVISELKYVKSNVENISKLKKDITEAIEIINMSLETNDFSAIEEILQLRKTSESRLSRLELLLLLNQENDKCNCILEIHPGAGGTESCDWALMLYRMYIRWCEKNNYKYEILDYQDGEEAGIKSVSISIVGDYAYGYLKNESGIHRLVRISPFDSNKRRHTSFASVDVIPEISNTDEVELNEKDLKIDVYRSSGAGGQHVNTTDSAVRITHLPTKIVVTCQNGRSQIQNKEKAMQVLKNKLKLLKEKENEEKLDDLKGDQKEINFGSQIRSYTLHPYSLVKDHRTNIETSNVAKVLDGDISIFIDANLRRK